MGKPDLVISIDVFDVQVGIFHSFRRCAKWCKKNVGSEPEGMDDANAAAFQLRSDQGEMFFGAVIPKGVSLGCVAHECVHLADFIMLHLGIPTDAENTEVRAHMVHMMVDTFIDATTC